MLSPIVRSSLWRDYSNKLAQLFADVQDDLYLFFMPASGLNDKDAPNVRKLSDKLSSLHTFVLHHCKELDDARYAAGEAEEAFNAWVLGLCPAVMKEITRTVNGVKDVWSEIAEYKSLPEINKEDTLAAIEMWKAHRASDALLKGGVR